MNFLVGNRHITHRDFLDMASFTTGDGNSKSGRWLCRRSDQLLHSIDAFGDCKSIPSIFQVVILSMATTGAWHADTA